jgi:hypothetical protein
MRKSTNRQHGIAKSGAEEILLNIFAKLIFSNSIELLY